MEGTTIEKQPLQIEISILKIGKKQFTKKLWGQVPEFHFYNIVGENQERSEALRKNPEAEFLGYILEVEKREHYETDITVLFTIKGELFKRIIRDKEDFVPNEETGEFVNFYDWAKLNLQHLYI